MIKFSSIKIKVFIFYYRLWLLSLTPYLRFQKRAPNIFRTISLVFSHLSPFLPQILVIGAPCDQSPQLVRSYILMFQYILFSRCYEGSWGNLTKPLQFLSILQAFCTIYIYRFSSYWVINLGKKTNSLTSWIAIALLTRDIFIYEISLLVEYEIVKSKYWWQFWYTNIPPPDLPMLFQRDYSICRV